MKFEKWDAIAPENKTMIIRMKYKHENDRLHNLKRPNTNPRMIPSPNPVIS